MVDQKQQKVQNTETDPQLAAQIALVQNTDSNVKNTAPPAAATQTNPVQPSQTDKSGKAITDADARALLATFNIQNPQKPERKLPMGVIITVATLIILAVLASTVIGLVNKNKSTATNPTNPNPSSQNSSPTNDTSNQINNDVNSCKNPEVALSEC